MDIIENEKCPEWRIEIANIFGKLDLSDVDLLKIVTILCNRIQILENLKEE